MEGLRSKFGTTLLLILILVVAVFFRFWSLDTAPPSLYPDEAANGVNAIEVLESGDYNVYYPDNNGREGLYINLLAVSFKLFGISPESLRMVSGLFGVLMVLGIFFLTGLLWNRKIAFLASYLSAISFWAINFSRIGFRAIILPAILVWAFYFLWLGVKRRKTWAILVSGLLFGLGMHTYISFRVMPLLIIIFFCSLLFNKSFNKKEILKWAFVFLVSSLVVASPLLMYYLQNPTDFMGRAGQVSVFNENSLIISLGETAIKTLGMFSFVGDFNWRHNFSGRPLLFWPIGIGFIIGFLILLGQIKKSKAKPEHFLLLWFLIGLLPNLLAPEGAPHALRALAVMPAVYIMSALGLWWIYNKIQSYFSKVAVKPKWEESAGQINRIKKEIAVLSILIILFIGAWEGRAYFVKWSTRMETANAFEKELTDIGDYIISSSSENKFVIDNSGGVAVYTIKFHTWKYKDDIKFINKNEINSLATNLDDATIIFVHQDKELLEKIKSKYPYAQTLGAFDGIKIK